MESFDPKSVRHNAEGSIPSKVPVKFSVAAVYQCAECGHFITLWDIGDRQFMTLHWALN